MPDCPDCEHLKSCAHNVRAGMPVVCEDDQNGQRKQITRQIREWIRTARPQRITTSLIAEQFGLSRPQAEYVLRVLSKKGAIVVVERRARREIVYRSAEGVAHETGF